LRARSGRDHRLLTVYARTINIVGGSAMVDLGFLGMFGVLWS
jgi:hypothetical protein